MSWWFAASCNGFVINFDLFSHVFTENSEVCYDSCLLKLRLLTTGDLLCYHSQIFSFETSDSDVNTKGANL